MSNFIDTVFDIAQTDNKLKYTLTHEDNSTELVQLSIATPVTTQGTALNKAYFDSVDDTIHEGTESESKSQTFDQTTVTTYTKTFASTGRRYMLFTFTWSAQSTSSNTMALFDTQTNKFIFELKSGGSNNELSFNVTGFDLYYYSLNARVRVDSGAYSNGTVTITYKGTKHAVQGNITVTARSYELDGYKEA